MVTINNPYSGASYQYEGTFAINGDFRSVDGHVTMLNGSIQRDGQYIGNVNVNNDNINVSVPRTNLRAATNDVYNLLDEIEAQINAE